MTHSRYLVGLIPPDAPGLEFVGGLNYEIHGANVQIGIVFFDEEGHDYVTTIRSVKMANRMLNALTKSGWIEQWSDELGNLTIPPSELRWPKRTLLQKIKRLFTSSTQ